MLEGGGKENARVSRFSPLSLSLSISPTLSLSLSLRFLDVKQHAAR